ncbi:MAG: S-layer homology domain-containing protein [Eubacteriales bacterium]|nr:S-layer homology domain-containing protein [Eubacteriales bacterium]
MKKLIVSVVLCLISLTLTASADFNDAAGRVAEIAAEVSSSENIEMLTGEAAIIMIENDVLKALESKGQTATMTSLKEKADEAIKISAYDDIDNARKSATEFLAELQNAFAVLGGNAEIAIFSDIKTNAWYYKAVKYTAENGIFAGTGNNRFEPEMEITRSMFLALMGRMYIDTNAGAPVAFTDVPENSYYAAAVNAAAAKGILTFIDGDKFYPDKPITREELVTVLKGSMAQNGIDTSFTASSAFIDNDTISSWANDAVSWAAEKKIVAGMGDGSFAPQNTATRSQVAQILYGVCK